MESNTTLPSQAKGTARQLTSHYSNISLFCDEAIKKLQGLTLASQHENDFESSTDYNDLTPDVGESPVKQHVISDVMFCNCCQTEFADREEQLNHYKCDWHRYNLHLRLKGLKFVSEEQFELVSGDVSSISGSDEDSEGENIESTEKLTSSLAGPPVVDTKPGCSMRDKRFDKIFFKNDQEELVSLYKCLFSHRKNPVKSSVDLLAIASQLGKQTKWAVLMVSAGHFAGALFNGKEVMEHKTFHRYTVRAKRGSAQSSRDSQGNAPKSAGASLRRYNEAALNQEVQDLLKSWQSNLDSCSLIFVRIPMGNRVMFYGGKNPTLKKDDLRIRIIPFPTRRPTFSEVKRVQQMLSCIECYGPECDVKDFIPLSPPRYYCRDTDQLEIRQPVSNPKPSRKKNNISEKCPQETSKQGDIVEEPEEDDFEIYPSGPGNPLEEFETHVEKKRRQKPKPVKTKATSPVDTYLKRDEDAALTTLRNALFTACKTGNAEELRKNVSELHNYVNDTRVQCEELNNDGQNENSQDSPKLQMEENSRSKSQSLKEVSDFLNSTFGDSANTFLHYASQENHHDIVYLLLHEGADPAIKNKNGKVPYLLGDTEVKNTYRRFMALFPEKYDYKQAQIPSPLTPEMEAAKKQKNAERRAMKKKSMQEKNKVKKAEEIKQKEENELKDRFLNLSDREKRALAAERRMLQQYDEQTGPKPVLSRCFQCAADMTGKVPFEYSDYKFCTTKCLREHRAKAKS